MAKRLFGSVGHKGRRLRHASFREAEECARAARLRGALLALARVGVWVWCEARSQSYRDTSIQHRRALQMAHAIHEGRLRLAWKDEP